MKQDVLLGILGSVGRKIRSTLWVLLFVALISGCIYLGGSLVVYANNLVYNVADAGCFVKGATTVQCQRLEDKDFYLWKVVAVRGQEVIYIEYKTPKIKPMLVS